MTPTMLPTWLGLGLGLGSANPNPNPNPIPNPNPNPSPSPNLVARVLRRRMQPRLQRRIRAVQVRDDARLELHQDRHGPERMVVAHLTFGL